MSFLPLLVLVIPTLVWGLNPTPKTQCSTVNLGQETLGAARNQGKISWCYAFTAADMLSYSFGEERISASDLALNYNTSFLGRVVDTFTSNGTPHETGFTKIALKQGMKDGFCPEAVFPSEKWIKVFPDREEIVPFSDAIKDLHLLHEKKDQLNLKNLPFYFKFKNVGPEEFLFLIKNNKLRNFYSELRTLACQDDRMPFSHRWKVKMALRNKHIFYRINEQLSLGRLVALDYDARILDNKDHQGVKLSELHTSPIVGRKWNEKKSSCEYLIRNSYGENCDRYDESYQCQKGMLWLSESQVFNSMISIVYMLHTPKI